MTVVYSVFYYLGNFDDMFDDAVVLERCGPVYEPDFILDWYV